MMKETQWPDLMYYEILGRTPQDYGREVPRDFDLSLEFVMRNMLTQEDIVFIRERFEQGLGVKGERCRQIKEKAIRKIRHPSRKKYLQYGLAEVERRKNEPPVVIPVIEQPIEELNLSPRVLQALPKRFCF